MTDNANPRPVRPRLLRERVGYGRRLSSLATAIILMVVFSLVASWTQARCSSLQQSKRGERRMESPRKVSETQGSTGTAGTARSAQRTRSRRGSGGMGSEGTGSRRPILEDGTQDVADVLTEILGDERGGGEEEVSAGGGRRGSTQYDIPVTPFRNPTEDDLTTSYLANPELDDEERRAKGEGSKSERGKKGKEEGGGEKEPRLGDLFDLSKVPADDREAQERLQKVFSGPHFEQDYKQMRFEAWKEQRRVHGDDVDNLGIGPDQITSSDVEYDRGVDATNNPKLDQRLREFAEKAQAEGVDPDPEEARERFPEIFAQTRKDLEPPSSDGDVRPDGSPVSFDGDSSINPRSLQLSDQELEPGVPRFTQDTKDFIRYNQRKMYGLESTEDEENPGKWIDAKEVSKMLSKDLEKAGKYLYLPSQDPIWKKSRLGPTSEDSKDGLSFSTSDENPEAVSKGRKNITFPLIQKGSLPSKKLVEEMAIPLKEATDFDEIYASRGDLKIKDIYRGVGLFLQCNCEDKNDDYHLFSRPKIMYSYNYTALQAEVFLWIFTASCKHREEAIRRLGLDITKRAKDAEWENTINLAETKRELNMDTSEEERMIMDKYGPVRKEEVFRDPYDIQNAIEMDFKSPEEFDWIQRPLRALQIAYEARPPNIEEDEQSSEVDGYELEEVGRNRELGEEWGSQKQTEDEDSETKTKTLFDGHREKRSESPLSEEFRHFKYHHDPLATQKPLPDRVPLDKLASETRKMLREARLRNKEDILPPEELEDETDDRRLNFEDESFQGIMGNMQL
ncbi:hypothetical protein AAMO2058_001201100 [Amorphochlora amoebiformis]